MLNHRIKSGVLLGLLLIASIIWSPPFVGLLVFMGIAAMASLEFTACARGAGLPCRKGLGVLGALLILVCGWLQVTTFSGGALQIEAFGLSLAMAAVFVRQFMDPLNRDALVNMAVTLLGMLYIGLLFGFMAKIFIAWGGPARLLLFYFFAVVKVSDIGAFFTGSAIGRHKLFPKLSPAKTWEGCAGGVMASLAVSLLFRGLSGGDFGVVQLNWLDAVVLGLLMPVVGILGDLVESQFKRAGGVKDSSHLIRGMGGILDVADSPMLAAPFFFVYVQWACLACC